jgi:nucleoside phosphorylase/tetratricopeptide (TPR) repeat protein
MKRRLQYRDYTVGLVCALPVEFAATQMMLDDEHEDLDQSEHDSNIYAFGRIGEHNVVIACLPAGQTGIGSAAAVASQLQTSFKSIRFGLLVGIGGGVPDNDVRLGDVVVSQPNQGHGGVIQYDFGKATPTGFERTGFLNAPPRFLLGAVTKMQANHFRQRNKLSENIMKAKDNQSFTREYAGPDILYNASYNHAGGDSCNSCSADQIVYRQPRQSNEVVIHYGTIASGNQVMRYGIERDRVSQDFGGVLCFEMEAAGLMMIFPCLVIRGICDYADSHKNKRWQAYAALTAAACARELLLAVPRADVAQISTAPAYAPPQSIQPTGPNEAVPNVVGVLYTPIADDSKSDQAAQCQNTGLYAEAHRLMWEVYTENERRYGPEHANTLTAACELAVIEILLDYGPAAYDRLGRLLPTVQRLFPPEDRLRLKIESLRRWGLYYFGQTQEAAQSLEEVLARQQRNLGEHHLDTLATQRMLSVIYFVLERRDQAVSLLKSRVDIFRRVSGENHIKFYQAQLDHIQVMVPLLFDNERVKAAPYSPEVYEASRIISTLHPTLQTSLGEAHPLSIRALRMAGSIKALQDKDIEASEMLNRAHSIAERTFGADHPETVYAAGEIGSLFIKISRSSSSHSGQISAAIPWLKRCLQWRESREGIQSVSARLYLLLLGGAYMQLKNYSEAKPYLERYVLVSRDPNSTATKLASQWLQTCGAFNTLSKGRFWK